MCFRFESKDKCLSACMHKLLGHLGIVLCFNTGKSHTVLLLHRQTQHAAQMWIQMYDLPCRRNLNLRIHLGSGLIWIHTLVQETPLNIARASWFILIKSLCFQRITCQYFHSKTALKKNEIFAMEVRASFGLCYDAFAIGLK